jgi:hypothetical protein
MGSENDWKTGLPEELQSEPVIQQTKDVTGLAKQLVDAQRTLGGAIRIPGDDAGADQVKEFTEKLLKVPGVVKVPGEDAEAGEVDSFFIKLGRPKDPEGYTAKGREDDPQFEEIRKSAFEMKLTNKQFTDMYARRATFLDEVHKAHEANTTKWAQDLKEKYGDGVKDVVERAEGMVEQLIDPGLKKQLDAMGLLKHPGMVNMMTKIADALDEESISKIFGGRAPAPVQHAGTAQQQIDEIMGNKEHPYFNRTDPGHEDAVQKVAQLYKVLASASSD